MEDSFLNISDIKKCIINNKCLDGKKVTLKYLEQDKVSVLVGIDENKHIYVLRIDNK